MAAAQLTMSGVTTTKGLVMILTLLCVLHLSSALINKDELEELKGNVETLQKETARRKAENNLDRAYVPAIFDDFGRLMDPMFELMKSMKFSPSLLTPLLDLMEDLKTFLAASKEYMDKYFETTAAEINDNEEKLRSVMATLTQLENNKDEL